MADSQVPYPYLPAQVTAIRASISEPRFGAYLYKGGGDVEYALSLYLYNARLAKAFLYPLHVVEVTLRNAIDQYLVSRHGMKWPHEVAFRDGVLSDFGRANLDKAVTRAGDGASRGQIVSELTFDFWSNLLRPEYHTLWRTGLNIVLPNVRRGTGRHEVQNLAKSINRFRNRVAHHEPILDQNVGDVQKSILELIALRCVETAAWTKHHSTVATVMRTRPRGGTGATVLARQAPDFVLVRRATTIQEVIAALDRNRQAAVCVDDDGRPCAAFSALDVTRFIAIDAARTDGLFAPGERTVADLLADVDAETRWAAIADDRPVGLGIDELRRPRIDVLVGVDAERGQPTGTILRAHRRY